MSLEDENQTETNSVAVNRETIREAILAQAERRRQEVVEFEEEERKRRRKTRVEKREREREDRATTRKKARVRAANEANERVRRNLTEAARSLSAALRAATEHGFPRHSEEGRTQQKTIKALQNAMAAVRRVGVGRHDEENVQVDLDLD